MSWRDRAKPVGGSWRDRAEEEDYGVEPRLDRARPTPGGGEPRNPFPQNSLEPAGRGALQGLTATGGDEAGGLGTALLQLYFNRAGPEGRDLWRKVTGGLVDVEEAPAVEAYKFSRDTDRAGNRLAREAKPEEYLPAEFTGGLMTSRAMPNFEAAKNAGAGARMLAALKTGGAQGGIWGLNSSESPTVMGDVGNTLAYGAGGAGVAGALSGGASMARGAWDLLKGSVKPTDAAKHLMSRGVPLTTGQMNPNSTLAQLEEVSTNIQGVGDRIKTLRGNAEEGWRAAVMDEAHAPVPWAQPPGVGGGAPQIEQRLASAKASFAPLYEPARGHKVWVDRYMGDGKWRPLLSTETERGAFDLATAKGNGIFTTDAIREKVNDNLRQRVSALPRNIETKQVDSGALLDLRSGLREEVRALRKGTPSQDDRAMADMFEKAENAITETLEQQLPKDISSGLRAADAKYGDMLKVQSAIANVGDRVSGLTPSALSRSIASGANKAEYAAGGGGELRRLAKSGREAIEGRAVKTGWGASILPNMWGGKYLAGGASMLSNVPSVQRFLIGATPFQKSATDNLATKGIDLLRQSALARALRGKLTNPYGAETEMILSPRGAAGAVAGTGDQDRDAVIAALRR